jgi:Fibronectin type III domain
MSIHGHRIRRRNAMIAALAAAAAALAAVGLGSIESPGAATARDPCQGSGQQAKIATAKLIIEYNATDNDIGVHGAFDDDGWSKLCVYDPSGNPILVTSPEAQLRDLTMAGIFFESREPPIDEFSFEDLKAKFPEGRYSVRALSFDGKLLTGRATFTHDVPAAPTVTSPADGAVVGTEDLVIEWEDVTQTTEGEPVTITGYEVIVTKVDHEDPHGFSQPIYDVHVPPDRNSLSVAEEFLQPGTEYELEVLALEESGNQTITVGFFTTQ